MQSRSIKMQKGYQEYFAMLLDASVSLIVAPVVADAATINCLSN